jgi:peptidoglycan-associated lipoprotein
MKNFTKAASLSLLLILASCGGKQGKMHMKDNPGVSGQNIGSVEHSPEVALKHFEENVLSVVLFDFDSSSLSERNKEILDKQAEWLSSNNNFNCNVIEGHCDKIGTREYNLALGERRAEEVKRYLVSCGVAPERLEVRSCGKEKLLRLGDTPEDHSENRRAVLIPGTEYK